MSGRPPPSIDGMTSLKIDNLSYRTDSESLRRKFEKYGDIGDVYVPKDKYGDTRGFAFVRFYDKRDAEDAIDAMDGKELDGRDLRVDIARHDRPRPCNFGKISRNREIKLNPILIKSSFNGIDKIEANLPFSASSLPIALTLTSALLLALS